MEIDAELLRRIPMIQKEHLSMLQRIAEHEHSPFWNYSCGDRLTFSDVPYLEEFAENLSNHRNATDYPSGEILEWLKTIQENSYFFKTRLKFISIEKQFFLIPVTTRGDLAESLYTIIPLTANLDGLVINPTSGTTGHSIPCPNHPRAIGCYNPLIVYAVEKNGGKISFDSTKIAALQIYYQRETAVYHTVKPILNGAGFAKLNLYPNSWRYPESPASFIQDMNPVLFTGNPIGFQELLKLDLSINPQGILSTSMALNPVLRKELHQKFNAPVVDFYSLNDTGPIGYSCPHYPEEFHVLPHDIYLEISDTEGNHLTDGDLGIITVTGGRNPYIPLVRYQTGDEGMIVSRNCSCGEKTPRFVLSDSRKPILFKTKTKTINPIDITRIIRRYAIIQHQFVQKEIDSFVLHLNTMPIFSHSDLENMKMDLQNLLGTENHLDITTVWNFQSPHRKVIPYVNLVE
jgi:phenylacetate-CoA ligase